jgi:O-acetyl-ADP-ribose deacetylase (regulator of RNase III)
MANLIPLSSIPTLSLLYKIKHIHPTTTTATPNQAFNDKVSLIRNDITRLEVDAIVNAANESLLGGGGVDGAIHRRAGPGLLRECQTLDGCDTGSAKITGGYELPAKKVIHAVGPIYWSTKKTNTHTSLLAGCYRTSLELAVENGVKSIAFSALSTGIYGYPSGEAAETAIATVKKFLEGDNGAKLDRVIFCSFERKDEVAYNEWIPKFFPPTEKDLSHHEQEEELKKGESVADQLPDPPTTEPTQEGEPTHKKAKVSHEDIDKDWEAVESTGESAENGPAEEKEQKDMKEGKVID